MSQDEKRSYLIVDRVAALIAGARLKVHPEHADYAETIRALTPEPEGEAVEVRFPLGLCGHIGPCDTCGADELKHAAGPEIEVEVLQGEVPRLQRILRGEDDAANEPLRAEAIRAVRDLDNGRVRRVDPSRILRAVGRSAGVVEEN